MKHLIVTPLGTTVTNFIPNWLECLLFAEFDINHKWNITIKQFENQRLSKFTHYPRNKIEREVATGFLTRHYLGPPHELKANFRTRTYKGVKKGIP